MSKFKTLMLSVVALLFMVTAAFADDDNAGCKNGKFVGTYTRLLTFSDLWGDGTNVSHTVVWQLQLHSDGNAFQYFTGWPDILLTSGTNSPQVGTWKCREDGKLVVNLLDAAFIPTTNTHGYPPPTDLLLVFHQRITFLLTVTDANTLTRTQARERRYGVTEDPSDPNAGTLQPLGHTIVTYKRMVASDADLLAP